MTYRMVHYHPNRHFERSGCGNLRDRHVSLTASSLWRMCGWKRLRH